MAYFQNMQFADQSFKPPRLEDEPGVNWSEEMKDFIRLT